ncbi:hypothetical protein FHU36_003438 [Nonomuraea muscovyensis]|uniref:ABC transporter substrate-binding protein n=1 Tax=Nonomuraea muscovyensis TaxID=1124761 RepID=A0A7X0EWU1_9ACTN|nr:hypothetical protein [Nonomuraea muscovyensis]MBB6346893.1 hypothetical protein [Nonomuraea muscovyensis]
MTRLILRSALTTALVVAGAILPFGVAAADAWDDIEIVSGPAEPLNGYIDQTSVMLQHMVDLLGRGVPGP